MADMTQMYPGVTSAQGTKAGLTLAAQHSIGRNPKTVGIIMASMLVLLLLFIVLWVVYLNKYKECSKSPTDKMVSGNLVTGGNNPYPFNQMGDAGWGGSMHSTYQPGESRVYGASADAGHTMSVVPRLRAPSCPLTSISPAATAETNALLAAQALGTDGSAKNMSDDALMRVMNGGSVL